MAGSASTSIASARSPIPGIGSARTRPRIASLMRFTVFRYADVAAVSNACPSVHAFQKKYVVGSGRMLSPRDPDEAFAPAASQASFSEEPTQFIMYTLRSESAFPFSARIALIFAPSMAPFTAT